MDRVRAIVISDLHLGGNDPAMMSHPEQLARFIHQLPDRIGNEATLELVINGDFIDFLAVLPDTRWSTADTDGARKVEATVMGVFAPVFRALAAHVAAGHHLTILVGNHDTEMVLPSVQASLLRAMGAGPHQVLFIADGRAHRIGGLLIEHGNRYDGANFNDWSGLRAMASAFSRNEMPLLTPEISAGSLIVEKVVNVLKPRYPFIDLLQPQGEIVAYLLAAFEPSLKYDWGKLTRALRGRRKEAITRPFDIDNVAAIPRQQADPEIASAFDDLTAHQASDENVNAGDWLRLFAGVRDDSLSEMISRGDPIPAERLRRIQLALQRMSAGEDFARWDGAAGACGDAAARMLGDGIEVVTMGHTHLARQVGPPDRATYINTGTWIDVIRLPLDVLEPGTAGLAGLDGYLRRLFRDDEVRQFDPTYADISVDPDGHISAAKLMRPER